MTIKTISMIPKVWVDDSPPRCQLVVVSWPKIKVDTDTKKNWVEDTSQMTQAASQIKVPTKAVWSLTLPFSQE